MISGIADHLWQSTLFAALAGLLTLAMRNNRAATRYWLWLAASVKFLIPFSILMWAGHYLSWRPAHAETGADWFVVAEQISTPFTVTAPPLQSPAAPVAPDPLLYILGMVRACGFAAVSLVWFLRWTPAL